MKKSLTKILLTTAVLASSMSAMASVAFEVEGKLNLNVKDAIAFPMIETEHGHLAITNVIADSVSKCGFGVYQVVNNIYPADTYTVLKLVDCYDIDYDWGTVAKSKPAFCPEYYAPVCAQPKMEPCEAGDSCIQVMPDKKTFSNSCFAAMAGAKVVTHQECK